MSKIWFTSDLHFGHSNIIKYCGRPYETVEEMNDGLILQWNSMVSEHDIIYHLGDFCLTHSEDKIVNWVNQLKGNIRFITVNHDTRLRGIDSLWVKSYFEKTFTVNGQKQKVVMFHFPIERWHGQQWGSWHLHGHCHGSLDGINTSLGIKRLDVGWDGIAGRTFREFANSLISLEELDEIFKYRTAINYHHGDY